MIWFVCLDFVSNSFSPAFLIITVGICVCYVLNHRYANTSLLFGMVYNSEANGMHLTDWSHNCSVAHKNTHTSEVCKILLFQIGSIW